MRRPNPAAKGTTALARIKQGFEHDRRDPPSEFFIDQVAKHLKLSKEHLIAAAGMWPTDLRDKLPAADPKKVEEAFTAFRKVLKEKP